MGQRAEVTCPKSSSRPEAESGTEARSPESKSVLYPLIGTELNIQLKLNSEFYLQVMGNANLTLKLGPHSANTFATSPMKSTD